MHLLFFVFDSESRYLLILTENYAALGILQQELLKIKNAIIIFGSSFPKDQEYTQVGHACNNSLSCIQTHTPVLLPFVRDYPGEPVPER